MVTAVKRTGAAGEAAARRIGGAAAPKAAVLGRTVRETAVPAARAAGSAVEAVARRVDRAAAPTKKAANMAVKAAARGMGKTIGAPAARGVAAAASRVAAGAGAVARKAGDLSARADAAAEKAAGKEAAAPRLRPPGSMAEPYKKAQIVVRGASAPKTAAPSRAQSRTSAAPGR